MRLPLPFWGARVPTVMFLKTLSQEWKPDVVPGARVVALATTNPRESLTKKADAVIDTFVGFNVGKCLIFKFSRLLKLRSSPFDRVSQGADRYEVDIRAFAIGAQGVECDASRRFDFNPLLSAYQRHGIACALA